MTSRRKLPPAPAPPPGSLRLQLPRGAIVRAAIGVFERLGAEATRVEDLLEAAGVARRTFYRYFRSKDDVLTAVYDTVTRELVAAIASHTAAAGDPIAGIRATLDIYLGFHADNHRILRVLIERGFQSDSALAPLRKRFREDLVAVLDMAFQAAKGVALDRYVFIALLSSVEGLSLELLSTAPTLATMERARRAVNGLFDALLASANHLPRA
jgi:AcrR family transcriptional regulator